MHTLYCYYVYQYYISPFDVGSFSCLFSVVGVYVGVRAKDVGNTGLDAYLDAGLVTSLMVSSRTRPHEIKISFLSLLVVPNTLIFHESTGLKGATFVLGASEWGATTWPVKPRSVDGQRSFQLDTSPDVKHKYIHITDVKGWLCKDLELVPPAACKEKASDGVKPAGMRMVARNDKVTALVRHSCSECFPLMKVVDMQALIRHLEIPVERMPTLEIDCASTLIDAIMPHLTDVEKTELPEKKNQLNTREKSCSAASLVLMSVGS